MAHTEPCSSIEGQAQDTANSHDLTEQRMSPVPEWKLNSDLSYLPLGSSNVDSIHSIKIFNLDVIPEGKHSRMVKNFLMTL